MAINWIQYPDSLTFNTSDKIIVSSLDGNTKNLSFPFTSSSSGITFNSDTYFTNLTETNETNGLVVDANGKLSYRANVDEQATHIYENVRNDEGATIPIGSPVYSKGEIGGSERIKVGIAKANDPTKMPAIGITNTELTTSGNTKDGLITLVGVYNNNLSGFTGLSTNQVVYVAPTGGLTVTKPTGSNLIQNVGIVLKTNSTIIQGLQVTCIGRTNDVPNPLAIDHANQLVGVGTTSPRSKLHIDGALTFTHISAPSNPATGTSVMWADTSGDLKIKINVANTVVTKTITTFE
tara:strand:- start:96 stop:974 length:879 start_codon:yes stop_codon:yes gene_type:complete